MKYVCRSIGAVLLVSPLAGWALVMIWRGESVAEVLEFLIITFVVVGVVCLGAWLFSRE
jgi:hypothetical protein